MCARRNNNDESAGGPSRPLKSHKRILDQEIHEAVDELARPARAQFISGLQAGFGFGVGFSLLLIAAILTLAPEGFPELYRRLLIANAYAIGFVLVIWAAPTSSPSTPPSPCCRS